MLIQIRALKFSWEWLPCTLIQRLMRLKKRGVAGYDPARGCPSDPCWLQTLWVAATGPEWSYGTTDWNIGPVEFYMFLCWFFLVLICKVFIQQYADHLYWPLCYLHVRASTLNASRISGISSCLYQKNPKYARWVKCRCGGLVNFAAAKIVAYKHCECPEMISPYLYAVFHRFSTFFLLSILGCQFMSILLAMWAAKRSSPFVKAAEACFVFWWRQTYLHGSKSLKYVRLLSTKLCW